MSIKTTTRLRVPITVPLHPTHQPIARAIAGGVVVLLVLFAFVADALERRRPAQDARPQIVYQPVYIIATPTPQPLPTEAPAVVVAPPTAEPEPTPTFAPEVVYQPVYIEVQAAPVVEAAPAPAAAEPAPIEGWVIHEPRGSMPGQCTLTRGGGICTP